MTVAFSVLSAAFYSKFSICRSLKNILHFDKQCAVLFAEFLGFRAQLAVKRSMVQQKPVDLLDESKIQSITRSKQT